MKYLPLPNATDVVNLRSLARNSSLLSYPKLAGVFRDVLKSYCSYRSVKGNAKAPGVPTPLPLAKPLKQSLRGHYTSPPQAIEPFISKLRERGSPDVCPMCGSPKAGTLDHVFPKDDYPELSFFSLNLVPACDCNIKRGTRYIGPGVDERVLHPYFDTFLQQQLVRAQIDATDEYGYERPKISLLVMIPPGSADFQAVCFHVENILKRTDVLCHFDATWPKLCKWPEDYFNLPAGTVTADIFRHAVRDSLDKHNRHYGTQNNWESMLFAGLEANQEAMAFLWQRAMDIRGGLIVP